MLVTWLVKTMIRFQARKAYAGGFNLGGWRAFMKGLGASAKIPKEISVEVVDLGGIRSLHFYPRNPLKKCAAVYFHGGLYIGGGPRDYRELVARISYAGNCHIYAVDYRIAPENPFPAAVEDARDAFAHTTGIHGRTAVIGDSAGAGLALAVMRGDSEFNLPVAGVLLSPMVDLTLSGSSIEERAGRDPLFRRQALESAIHMYLGDHSRKDPDASPLFADLSGYPPLQIHIGTEEMLFDDARRLVENAKRAGVEADLYEWDDMFHDFQLAARILKEGRESVSLIGEFLRRHMPA